ncbi:MAG: hypothetical protein PHH04_06330 [Thomasclavelia sp.]|jgi:hypothetical protein|nr:hypothetical protein [Thomasclavelia sp.]
MDNNNPNNNGNGFNNQSGQSPNVNGQNVPTQNGNGGYNTQCNNQSQGNYNQPNSTNPNQGNFYQQNGYTQGNNQFNQMGQNPNQQYPGGMNNQNPNGFGAKFKQFISTTKGKVISIVVVAALVIGTVIIVTNPFQKDTDIDLATDAYCTFTGINGKGEVNEELLNVNNSYEYSKNNDDKDINAFLDTVTYTMDKKSGLSNGDTITVTANYDEEKADDLHLNITNDKCTLKVKDLEVLYQSSDKVTSDIVTKVKTVMDTSANQALKNTIDGDASISGATIEYQSMYFGFNNSTDDPSNMMVGIYKLSLSGHHYYIYWYLKDVTDQGVSLMIPEMKELTDSFDGSIDTAVNSVKTDFSSYSFTEVK